MRRVIRRLVIDGVTLQSPRPLGSVTLRFTPGVDVLYGLNGSGKSRVLQSLLTTLGLGDGHEGGVVHLSLKDVLTEPQDIFSDPQTEDFDWGDVPFWYVELLDRAKDAVARLEMSQSGPWRDEPGADWFTYLVAGATWSRLVHSGLDPELAESVTWAVASGTFRASAGIGKDMATARRCAIGRLPRAAPPVLTVPGISYERPWLRGCQSGGPAARSGARL